MPGRAIEIPSSPRRCSRRVRVHNPCRLPLPIRQPGDPPARLLRTAAPGILWGWQTAARGWSQVTSMRERDTAGGRLPTRALAAGVVLAILSAAACGHGPAEQDDALTAPEFVDIVVALRKAERGLQPADSTAPEFEERKQAVLAAHHATESDVRAFVDAHGGDFELMTAVWDSITQRLRYVPPDSSEAAGPVTAPDSGRATAPDSGRATAPDSGRATAPDSGRATAPARGRATPPDSGGATAPARGRVQAPDSGPVAALDTGSVSVRDSGAGTDVAQHGVSDRNPPPDRGKDRAGTQGRELHGELAADRERREPDDHLRPVWRGLPPHA